MADKLRRGLTLQPVPVGYDNDPVNIKKKKNCHINSGSLKVATSPVIPYECWSSNKEIIEKNVPKIELRENF